MSETGLTKETGFTSFTRMRWMVTGAALAAGGCVSINAPTKPIEINLNISVTQEVVYRLDNSAKELIKENPEKIIIAAVKGMLPKNKLQNEWLKRLHVYPTEQHPHQANVANLAVK